MPKFCSDSGVGDSCDSSGLYAQSRALVQNFQGKIDASCRLNMTNATGLASIAGDLMDPEPYLSIANFIVGGMCSSVGGTYCWPSFDTAAFDLSSKLFGADPAEATDEVMEAGCSDCTRKVMTDLMVASAGSDDKDFFGALMEMACYKDGTKWCMRETMILLNDGGFSDVEQQFCGELCFKRIMGMMVDLFEPRDLMMEMMLDMGCFINPGPPQSVCLEAMGFAGYTPLGYFLLEESCGAPEGPTAASFPTSYTCDDSCKSAWTRFRDSWGCCANLFLSYDVIPTGFKNYFAGMETACDAVLPPACEAKETADIGFCLNLDNLKYSYYAAKKSDLDKALCKEIAKRYGVSQKMCTVESSESYAQALGDATKICLLLKFTTQGLADAAQTEIEAAAATTRRAGSVAIQAFTSLPVAAKLDPLVPISGTTTITSVSTTIPSCDEELPDGSHPIGCPEHHHPLSSAPGLRPHALLRGVLALLTAAAGALCLQ